MSAPALEIEKSFHYPETGSPGIIRTLQERLLGAFAANNPEDEKIDPESLTPTFDSLDTLIHEVQRHPDDTSETLKAVSIVAEEICVHFSEAMNNGGDIASAWSALYAWDVARSPETQELVHKVLREFQGIAQPQLLDAYMRARDNGTRIDIELDRINASIQSAVLV